MGLAGSQTKGVALIFTVTLGSGSSIVERSSFFKSLSTTLHLASSFFRGRAIYLSSSLGSASALAEKNSLYRSLIGSLSPVSGLGGTAGFFRSLSDSWTANSLYTRGSSFTETLSANFAGANAILSGNYDCHENVIGNCGVASASFAFLAIAIGASAFVVYVATQHWQSPSQPEPEKERVSVDEEGWETRTSREEGGWETRVTEKEEDPGKDA
jgi:hypothetical protein